MAEGTSSLRYLSRHSYYIIHSLYWRYPTKFICSPVIQSVTLLAALIFIVLWWSPEPAPIDLFEATLVLYGIGLFAVLSDFMRMGLATFLTRKRGDKWIKEMDYFYLLFGVVGLLGSMNRIEIFTGRIERTDIIAPLILMTAIVIRVLKTRADIAGWNKLT